MELSFLQCFSVKDIEDGVMSLDHRDLDNVSFAVVIRVVKICLIFD